MIDLNNICSVTDFQRNPKGILGKLKKSHAPIILTVKGKAEMVVQEAESYQEPLNKLSAAEDLEAIREGLLQMQAGGGRPVGEFFDEFEAKHGL